nr:MAG TPA: hypothetical protein [Caudoviricetes sp.]
MESEHFPSIVVRRPYLIEHFSCLRYVRNLV